jgi:hypothetical protein
MRRVLEILMEVERLTPTERVSVQDNLAGLHSHTTASVGTFTQPGQQRYAFLCWQPRETHP